MSVAEPLIVLIGIPSEPPVRLAVEAAERAGIDAVVVHQRPGRGRPRAAVGPGRPGGGVLVSDGREVPLGSIAGVYCRAT